jgi:hypothetical protein
LFAEPSLLKDFVHGLPSASPDDLKRALDSFVADPSQQQDFAEHLLKASFPILFFSRVLNGITKKFAELSKASDLTSLASLCEALYTHSTSLDVIALHISIPSLLSICLNLVDSLDWESIGETPGNTITLADCVCR